MANNTPIANKIEQVADCVQEIPANGQEPPGRYCYRDGVIRGSETCCLPLLEIPVIDIGLLASSSNRRQGLEKLLSALNSFGCFMSVNHGMTGSFLEEVRSVIRQFFALPVDEQQKFAKEVDCREGYGNDSFLAENQALDWNDRLFLVQSPPDQRHLRFWPKKPANFMDIISEYTVKLELLIEVVLKAIASSLDLEDHCFLDKCGVRATMNGRFNLYPPCSRHDLVLGLKPHSDLSAISIVLQDKEVEGLQFLKDDQWFRVPIIPEALLIIIGDQMQIMSNGMIKSPVHRVAINPEKERYSLVVFYFPDPDTDIEPVEGLVNDTSPRQYKKVKNYAGSFLQYYPQGKRLMDDLKI